MADPKLRRPGAADAARVCLVGCVGRHERARLGRHAIGGPRRDEAKCDSYRERGPVAPSAETEQDNKPLHLFIASFRRGPTYGPLKDTFLFRKLLTTKKRRNLGKTPLNFGSIAAYLRLMCGRSPVQLCPPRSNGAQDQELC